MPYSVAGKNIMLGQLRRSISHISLHSGAPEASNEIRGGAYTRVAVEFRDPTNGVMRMSGDVAFDVPEGLVNHAAFWTAAKGGVMLATGELDETLFSAQGVYMVDAATLDLNLGG